MPTEEFVGIVASGTADVSCAQDLADGNADPEMTVPLADAQEVMPQFQGRVLRIMDDQVFLVDPGSPPVLSTR